MSGSNEQAQRPGGAGDSASIRVLIAKDQVIGIISFF